MAPPPIIVQAAYAELLERCAAAAFRSDFSKPGTFVAKTVRGRRYWYFQEPAASGKAQKYVGPETAELLEKIEHYRETRDDRAQRRALVSALLRVQRSPRPPRDIGETVAALANAGVFRLRGVLVGTVAFQTYSAMLGVAFGAATVGTEDVDIAQFREISVAVEDTIPPILDVLRDVDGTFRPIPSMSDGRRIARYTGRGGLRVDFLTPNRGADTRTPQSLPALRTDTEPLRFLDFLIRDPEPAVVLHGPGIYVSVPAPQRFAIHKLIVARRRPAGSAKQEKDLAQAGNLLDVLAEKRPYDLGEAWQEMRGRGRIWRKLAMESFSLLPAKTQAGISRAIPKL